MSRRAKSKFKFRLYVAGDAQNSAEAVANLTALCRAYLKDRHAIEVVNVFREPKLAPAPAPRKIVGTLSQTQPVLQALGLETLTVNP